MGNEPPHTQTREPEATVFLVNATENPDAKMDTDSFARPWSWIAAPEEWRPEDGMPSDAPDPDAILVFSTVYQERAIRDLCEKIRFAPNIDDVPLLVAVNQYEMPLANRVKEMPKAHFIFTPIMEEDLKSRIDRLAREDEGE